MCFGLFPYLWNEQIWIFPFLDTYTMHVELIVQNKATQIGRHHEKEGVWRGLLSIWKYVFVSCCCYCFLEEALCQNDYQWDGNSVQQSFCPTFAGELLGHMVHKELRDISKEATYDERINQKKKRPTTGGKYTTNARGSKRCGGWSKEGLDSFN